MFDDTCRIITIETLKRAKIVGLPSLFLFNYIPLIEWVTKRIFNYLKNVTKRFVNTCFEYISSVLSIGNTIMAINQMIMIIRYAN